MRILFTNKLQNNLKSTRKKCIMWKVYFQLYPNVIDQGIGHFAIVPLKCCKFSMFKNDRWSKKHRDSIWECEYPSRKLTQRLQAPSSVGHTAAERSLIYHSWPRDALACPETPSNTDTALPVNRRISWNRN